MKRLFALTLSATICVFAAEDSAALKQRIAALEKEIATLKEENQRLKEKLLPQPSYDSIQDCLSKRGDPVVVANSFRFEKNGLPTISFYELDKTEKFALFTKRERFLVYTSDIRFSQIVRYHFTSMHDPTAWTGSTMFGAVSWPIQLELVHFDAEGKFVETRPFQVVIAYFEAGREGHLIRHPTKKK